MRLTLIKFILYCCAYLPLPIIHGIGVCIGWGLLLIPNRSRQSSEINIALCWPELSAREQRSLLRNSLRETGKTIIETSALWLRSGKSALRLIKRVDGKELVVQAIAQGKGAILATPHLGAWEAAGLYGSEQFRITCLYRPLKIPELETLVQHSRNRLGGNYVPATAKGVRALYKALDQGHVVAMLPDQEPKAGTGIFAPFFGIPAYSMVFLAKLAARTGAPIIFAWCERLSWGRGYHLHFRAMSGTVQSGDIHTTIAAINQAAEDCVRECPEQYQWSYRRFKTRPEGEASFYKKKHPAIETG
ncbi:MAG TPA: lipid A biosynthesis acyltransferase [Gammaproteobacteria bacterium]|nr:lipid A biosynthesis acyltransferase [Gammaproteobacteria bacterium]